MDLRFGQAEGRGAARAMSQYMEQEHNLSASTEKRLAEYYSGELRPLTDTDKMAIEVMEGRMTFQQGRDALAKSRFADEDQERQERLTANTAHVQAWADGKEAPDLDRLAEYVETALAGGSQEAIIEAGLVDEIDNAIRVRLSSLPPQARRLHGLSEPEEVPSYLASLSDAELEQRRDTILDDWREAQQRASFRQDVWTTGRAEAVDTIGKDLAGAVAKAEAVRDMISSGTVAAEPRADMSPRMQALLGIDASRPLTGDEMTEIMFGQRADGLDIQGKAKHSARASVAEIFGLDPTGPRPAGAAIDNISKGLRADGGKPVTAGGGDVAAHLVEGARKRLFGELGVPGYRNPEPEELDRMRRGLHAVEDGLVNDKTYYRTIRSTHPRTHYFEAILAPDKTVSIAWALAPTDAERTVIMGIHKQSVADAMAYVEQRLGWRRLGKGGGGGVEQGEIGWASYGHYTARPTAAIIQMGDDNQPFTALQAVPIKQPDMHVHEHIIVPNVILTESGKVGSIDGDDFLMLTKEFGAVYQASIARHARSHGIDIKQGDAIGEARFAAVPDRMRQVFQKRTESGQEEARKFAQSQGKDWDRMGDKEQIEFLRKALKDSRLKKRDVPSDFAEWEKEALAAGYKHRSVLRPNEIPPELSREQRIQTAYDVTLPLVEAAFERRAKIDGQEMRELAARGFVLADISDNPRADIDAVTAKYRSDGIRQQGGQTALIWGQETMRRGKERWSVTTDLGVAREEELIAMAREAMADRRGALAPEQIEAAQRRYLAAHPNIDPTSSVWQAQSVMAQQLGTGGKLAVGIGGAGAGKSSAVLSPLVDAWKADNRPVYGVSVAWRTATALGEAGVDKPNQAALAAFLMRVERGAYKLDERSVVVIDEVSLIGNRQFLELLHLQKQHGFTLVAVGDNRQAQSIEPGGLIDLIERAMPGTIPSVVQSIRQQSQRERDIVKMFRDGRIDEALEEKRKDKTAELVVGGREETLKRVGQLWRQRTEANAADPDFRLTVSAPTRADARAISVVIREEMRSMERLGEDTKAMPAVDNAGDNYELRLAPGDRIQALRRIEVGHHDMLLANGDVGEVVRVEDKGALLKRMADGREAFVPWEGLQDKAGRLQLSYGYAGTIDVAQGITSDEHINALISGSGATQILKNYVGNSRHRVASWIVIDESSERRQITKHNRSLMPTRDDVWNNVVKNMKREPAKASALEFVRSAARLRYGTVRTRFQGQQPQEQRDVERKAAPARTFVQDLEIKKATPAMRQLAERVQQMVAQNAIVQKTQQTGRRVMRM